MPEVTLFHNPRCSKSRQAKALLDERGIDFTIVEYLKTPLSLAELQDLQRQLGVPVREMVRRKEAAFAENGLADADDERLLAAIADHPILLERPVVVVDERAVIARPPERLGELL